MTSAFGGKDAAKPTISAGDLEKLHARIGQLGVERDFLSAASSAVCRRYILSSLKRVSLAKDRNETVQVQTVPMARLMLCGPDSRTIGDTCADYPRLRFFLISTTKATPISALHLPPTELGRIQSVSHPASLRRHPIFTRLAVWGIKLQRMGLDRLFRSHRGDVRSYLARMLRDADLAEDLTQDAFLRCFAMVQAGGRPENLRGYLYRVARNIAVDHLRLQKRRRTDAVDGAGIAAIADPRPGAEHVLIDRERLRVFVQAVMALPHKTRRIFILHRIHGLSYREVAAQMELSESSVQKHLARALCQVTCRLQDYEDCA